MIKSFKKQFSKPDGFLGVIAGKIMALENRKLNSWTISSLGIKDHDVVLEIGYGSGMSMEKILKQHKNIMIDGIDVSETMQKQAAKRLDHDIKNQKVHLMIGDVEKVNLNPCTYNKIMTVNNYTIWDHPEKGLANLYDSLKPKGKIAITMQPREENASSAKTRMFAKQIFNDLTTCGFLDIKVQFKRIRPELAVCVTAVKGE
ncbi:class I SAM-dependent methyltransferase [Metabacillus litoralis]|uniref:class I SAM-dependent methyltransferase n=1 Tax=Metabacillus litoralis TaxID=152268 RepID=UPI001CFEFB0B|nr:class I SAM-dependent methyltransferase [Metabacillus litoralis]